MTIVEPAMIVLALAITADDAVHDFLKMGHGIASTFFVASMLTLWTVMAASLAYERYLNSPKCLSE